MFDLKNHRVGIIGGSFDPIHLGHLVIAQDAVERLELDEVVFIPAAIPPHKQHLERVGAEHRLRMVELAIEGDLRFSVSDMELVRGGVSYTIDTVQMLQESRPDVDWVLIVGSDTLVDLHNWHRIDDLLDLCTIASFLRPGESSLDRIAEKIELPEHRKQQVLA
nr:nicotinate-nucleotide adenylyltransferase [Spirochaetales bacterium]